MGKAKNRKGRQTGWFVERTKFYPSSHNISSTTPHPSLTTDHPTELKYEDLTPIASPTLSILQNLSIDDKPLDLTTNADVTPIFDFQPKSPMVPLSHPNNHSNELVSIETGISYARALMKNLQPRFMRPRLHHNPVTSSKADIPPPNLLAYCPTPCALPETHVNPSFDQKPLDDSEEDHKVNAARDAGFPIPTNTPKNFLTKLVCNGKMSVKKFQQNGKTQPRPQVNRPDAFPVKQQSRKRHRSLPRLIRKYKKPNAPLLARSLSPPSKKTHYNTNPKHPSTFKPNQPVQKPPKPSPTPTLRPNRTTPLNQPRFPTPLHHLVVPVPLNQIHFRPGFRPHSSLYFQARPRFVNANHLFR